MKKKAIVAATTKVVVHREATPPVQHADRWSVIDYTLKMTFPAGQIITDRDALRSALVALATRKIDLLLDSIEVRP